MDNLELHVLIEKEDELYSGLCLELDVASQGRTPQEARENLRGAIMLYLADVYAAGDEAEFIPRSAPAEEWLKFFEARAKRFAEKLRLGGPDMPVVLQEAVYG